MQITHSSPYLVRSCEFSLKLEPIVNMFTFRTIAFEFLSMAIDPHLNNELFFKLLNADELIQLCQRQLERFQKLNEQDSNIFSSIFLNIPTDFLYDMSFFEDMHPFCRNFKINFEIECDCSFFLKNEAMRQVSKSFISNGVQIWLDDVDFTQLKMAEVLIHSGIIYGVKLDKHSFWRCYEDGLELYKFADEYRERLIVEGIETDSHLTYAKSQSLILGQGFFWR